MKRFIRDNDVLNVSSNPEDDMQYPEIVKFTKTFALRKTDRGTLSDLMAQDLFSHMAAQ